MMPSWRSTAAFACLVLLAACGGGGGGGDGSGGGGGGPPVPVAGKVTFDLVPLSAVTNGLAYQSAFAAPARGVIVEAVSASGGTVLDSTSTDAQGDYQLDVPAATQVFIRARARMQRSGTPGWDFRVVDNTGGGAQYVLDGGAFDSGDQGSIRDLHADSGWDGAAYSGTRSAAPFAILDAVYEAYNAVLDVAPDAVFPLLTLNWSPDNVPVPGDESSGEIGTTFYSLDEIFILGAVNNDTDEYDRHVLIHEWGHYFEDNFSRTDSIGGPHSAGDRLDPRVAFSEGWGYAFAGIATGDPVSRDSSGPQQQGGFAIDVERNANANPGWYSEGSVQSVLYDIFDPADDGVDVLSLGFAPLYEILVGPQRNSQVLATLFTFVPALKSANPADADAIDAIVAGQDVVSVDMDETGSTETNDAGSGDVLPVYTPLPMSTPVQVCSVSEFGTFNKLSVRRFLSFSIGTTGSYEIRADGPLGSDPDLVLHQGGFLAISQSENPGFERFEPLLSPGEYVLEVYEFSNTTTAPRGRTCIDVRVDPT